MPNLRDRPDRLGWSDVRYMCKWSALWAAVIMITIAAFGILGSCSSAATAVSHNEKTLGIEELLNSKTPKERIQFMEDYKVLTEFSTSIDEPDSGNTLPDEFFEQVEAMETGAEFVPNYWEEKDMWSIYWTGITEGFWIWVIIAILAFLAISPLVHGSTLSSNKYLVDVEINPPAICIFAISMLPIGWMFYLASLTRILLFERDALRRRRRERAADRQNPPLVANVPCDEDTSNQDETLHDDQAVPVFKSNIEWAKKHFFAMRKCSSKDLYDTKKRQLEREQENLKVGLNECGEEIKSLQGKLKDVRVQIKKFEQDYEHHEPTSEELEFEFAQLLSIQNIVAIRPYDSDAVSIQVSARIPYKNKIYYVGDWEIRIRPNSNGRFDCRRIASGVFTHRRGRYPDYAYDNGEFCFGSRYEAISSHIYHGRYLAAVELIVACLCSVNEDDEHKIPETFRRIKDAN